MGEATESVPSAHLVARSPPHTRFDQQSRKDCVSPAKGIHKGIGSASGELSQSEMATGGLGCGPVGCVETTRRPINPRRPRHTTTPAERPAANNWHRRDQRPRREPGRPHRTIPQAHIEENKSTISLTPVLNVGMPRRSRRIPSCGSACFSNVDPLRASFSVVWLFPTGSRDVLGCLVVGANARWARATFRGSLRPSLVNFRA